VGGTAASFLGSRLIAGSENAYMYGLLSPPTGTKTVVVTLSTTGVVYAGNSDSYTGVSSFGTASTNSGSSSPASVSVSSASGQTAVAALMTASGSAFTGFNQTSRWNNGSAGSFIVFGDAAGASTVSFSATPPAGSWAAIGVSLVGALSSTPPSTIASPTYSTNVPWFGLGNTAVTVTPTF